MLTFDPACEDCKYCSEGNCIHPYEMYCENYSLWWPKEDNAKSEPDEVMVKHKPCPFCKADLIPERQDGRGAKRYADIPFEMYFVHPLSGCLLSGTQIKAENMYKWDRRASDG